MKKPPRPQSQLILFSNSHEPMIEHWCSGSVVFEMDMDGSLDNFPEIELLREILFRFGERYSKVTLVTNPRVASVTMCRLSGRFPVSTYIVGKNGYKSFDSYTKCMDNFFRLKVLLEASKSSSLAMKKFSNFRAHESYFKYRPSKELKVMLSNHIQHEDVLRRVLDSPFQ